ncbi:DICT sensory domain-containing protein [Nocardioides sp. TF02-7]|uniref:DICT sensory domain-containing protein n=1 Tax=Nocardioides sp. TF02-7 TaxID=2917724 RepID=UPI001F064BFB|nr:DICT sensory domain-containing protein [Nocardioides sp. TF02-7]UMG93393.1 hypothetical protein MF408_03845 [Nocardioides sp. TF02-7]
MPLRAAVRAAGPEPFPTRSVFAEVRRRHQQLVPRVLSKPTMVALSHAIEDECCARAARPVLFGGFQQPQHLRAAHARWVELARTARVAVAFGAHQPAQRAGSALVEAVLPDEAALNREWLIVCDASDLPACLLAVERPGQSGGAEAHRRFEVVWSVEPLVVRDAARAAGALADEYAPGWRPADLVEPVGDPPRASPDLARASALFDRMLGYLEEAR